jgi:hypothetical protein
LISPAARLIALGIPAVLTYFFQVRPKRRAAQALAAMATVW